MHFETVYRNRDWSLEIGLKQDVIVGTQGGGNTGHNKSNHSMHKHIEKRHTYNHHNSKYTIILKRPGYSY